MAAGALYRAELAHQLEKRLGCYCEREEKGSSFFVSDVPESLCDEFSKRRAEIEDRLKSYGAESASAAAVAQNFSPSGRRSAKRSASIPSKLLIGERRPPTCGRSFHPH
jgi:conjugative relaxase-like TrwC/TraI family protein